MPVTQESACEMLRGWLAGRLGPDQMAWLEEACSASGDTRRFYLRISQIARKLGKGDLDLSEAELAEAERLCPGWWPGDWSIDQAARVYLLVAGTPEAQFAERLRQLCVTADVGELIAFYRGLPLYPDPKRHVTRAAEGVRSNIRSVFEAVAHHNPYPAAWFDDGAWNQMVLKALFIGAALHPIRGLERRANPVLREMLCNYAHERWVAKRAVSPELWRCVGPVADEEAIDDLERVLLSGGSVERQAAVLALRASGHSRAKDLLSGAAELDRAAAEGRFSWQTVHASLL